ncbi:MAG: hypothetical protein M5U14_12805 [Acidimicrobiia bacterium]|nr:hypothetical protein [Acidimicrobiia bacterium]
MGVAAGPGPEPHRPSPPLDEVIEEAIERAARVRPSRRSVAGRVALLTITAVSLYLLAPGSSRCSRRGRAWSSSTRSGSS